MAVILWRPTGLMGLMSEAWQRPPWKLARA
jgi:hypothetical protein